MTARHTSYLYLLLVAAIWGFAPPLVKLAFVDIPPLLFLTYRFALTNIVLLPLLLTTQPDTWRTLSTLSLRDWFFFIISGLLGSTVQLGLLFIGLNYTTSLDASIIGAIPPILVAIGATIFLKEKVSRKEAVGLAISFLGSVIIVIQPVFSGQSFFSGSILGNFLVFLGAITWTAYVLITKQELRHKLTPLLLTTNMFFTGFISVSIITLFIYKPLAISYLLTHARLGSHLVVIYMAFISGALGYFLYQKAQKTITASQADIFLYLSPVFTAPLSYYWLGEPITLTVIIGSVIIAAGVALSELSR